MGIPSEYTGILYIETSYNDNSYLQPPFKMTLYSAYLKYMSTPYESYGADATRLGNAMVLLFPNNLCPVYKPPCGEQLLS